MGIVWIAVQLIYLGTGDEIPVVMFTSIRLGCQSGDPVVSVDESNEEMNKAMETARSPFPQFVKKWKAPSNMATSVKFGLPTRDDRVEHIWFEPISPSVPRNA